MKRLTEAKKKSSVLSQKPQKKLCLEKAKCATRSTVDPMSEDETTAIFTELNYNSEKTLSIFEDDSLFDPQPPALVKLTKPVQ